MAQKSYGFDTAVIHAGELKPRVGGALALPIFQSTVYEQAEEGSYHDIVYPRLNNLPNHRVLAGKLAALEEAEDAVVTASGMAAITTALIAVLADGGHLLVQDCLYGGTHNFVTEDFAALGFSYDFVDAEDRDSWRAKLRPNTRAIYVEALTNPLLQVADHRGVIDFARTHDLVAMIDSTFATPVNFRPARLGYDVILHSCTKYLNGHSDLVAGAIVGRRELLQRVRHRLNHLGGTLDPHACFLLHRGMKTLALRVRQQNASALRLAQHLAARADVEIVHYAGLETHRGHAIARELFAGYGGVLSFEPAGGTPRAREVVRRVKLPTHGPSLGGVETLITRPVTTSHAGMAPADRARLGINDSLIRVAVGIEDGDDLIDDFSRALDATP